MYDYWELVKESGIISQHISSIVIFIAIFIHLYLGNLSAEKLLVIGGCFTLAGYSLWDLTITRADPEYVHNRKYQGELAVTVWEGGKTAKGAMLFFTYLLGLSPILRTLTEDTNSDTIWALTVLLLLANTLFHDYQSRTSKNISGGTISLNAAIFASVLLASRLHSNTFVFALMSFAIIWFALFPMFRRHLRVSALSLGKHGTHHADRTCQMGSASCSRSLCRWQPCSCSTPCRSLQW